jgi:RNase H-fold protein (predicted Holliday junction resolvase)
MSILALDIGTRHTGVALSESGIAGEVLPTIHHENVDELVIGVRKLCLDYAVTAVVIGMPLTLHDEETPQAQLVQSAQAALQAGLADQTIEWHEENEFGTSSGGADDHGGAAAVILQNFLDGQVSA